MLRRGAACSSLRLSITPVEHDVTAVRGKQKDKGMEGGRERERRDVEGQPPVRFFVLLKGMGEEEGEAALWPGDPGWEPVFEMLPGRGGKGGAGGSRPGGRR